jgi:pimeloyl-ACP methyl ester carboxylesterase
VRVVLLHGIGVTGDYFRPLARELSPQYDVRVPTLPGWGGAPKPRRTLDLAELGEALVPLLPGAIVANSLGCQVAVELAVRHPELVSSLVLIGPTIDPHHSIVLGFARDGLREPPSLWWLITRDYARMGVRRFVRTARFAYRQRLAALLPRVAAPTLVLRGAHDGLVSERWCTEVAALLPHGRFVPLAVGGHAVHYTDPGVVAQEVEQHLGEG